MKLTAEETLIALRDHKEASAHSLCDGNHGDSGWSVTHASNVPHCDYCGNAWPCIQATVSAAASWLSLLSPENKAAREEQATYQRSLVQLRCDAHKDLGYLPRVEWEHHVSAQHAKGDWIGWSEQ